MMSDRQCRRVGVVVRSRNLNIIDKSLTCEDLPLKGDTNVAACEQAIGEFA